MLSQKTGTGSTSAPALVIDIEVPAADPEVVQRLTHIGFSSGPAVASAALVIH